MLPTPEQLLLHVGFMETVKLHSIDFVAPTDGKSCGRKNADVLWHAYTLPCVRMTVPETLQYCSQTQFDGLPREVERPRPRLAVSTTK